MANIVYIATSLDGYIAGVNGELDWLMVEHCSSAGVPLHCLLTKSDKLSRNQVKAQLLAGQSTLESAGVEASLQDFSALKGQGVDDAHSVLDEWLSYELPSERPERD